MGRVRQCETDIRLVVNEMWGEERERVGEGRDKILA